MLQLTDRQSAHTLTVLSLLTLFSFVDIGNSANRSFWLAVRAVGCGCAIGAVYGYRKADQDAELTDENGRLLEAVGEVKQGHDWEKYNLQLQYQREIEHYDRALAQLQHQLQQAQSSNLDQIEAEKDKLTIAHHRLHQEREALNQQNTQLDAHFAQQQQILQDKEQGLSAQVAELEQSFQEQLTQARAQLTEQTAALEERERLMLENFEREWAEREAFYAQVTETALRESHSLKQPDYPLGHTHEELLASEAIRCLYDHGLIVKHPVVQGLRGGRFELRFQILPVLVDGKISTPIRSLGEAYKRIERDLLKTLRIAVRGCCADPSIEPIDGGLKLTFDVSGTDWEALEQERKAKADVIPDPDPAHLSRFIRTNPQLCLMGDSGEGKTTLINNLVSLMEQELGNAAQLYIINPKPNEDTDLSKLKYADFETCIFGLLEAATEILHRLDLNTSALLQRRNTPDHPLPQFAPLIYFFDEFSELAGVWNKCKPDVMEEVLNTFTRSLPPDKIKTMEFVRKRVSPSTFAADLLKFCWRVGRTEQVKLLIAGQNLKAGTIGTTIQDLHQTAIIYLGEAIREGLDNRISSWQKDPLNQEYAHRSQKVAEGKANRFYGLFVPKGSKSYFATLPDESAFTDPNTVFPSSTENAPTAPTAPVVPESVQALERLWQLPDDDRTDDDRTRTEAVQGQYDPLELEITPQLTEAVLRIYDAYKSQTKVIELVWNAGKSGTSQKYRAAKWKFRRILKKHHRTLPGKPWGEDSDDLKSFSEVIV